MTATSRRTCFVAGVPGDPTTRDVMSRAEEVGLDVTTAFDTPPSRQSRRHGLRQLIRRVDLVIAVAAKQRHSPLPMFELGIATALNRPVLIITPPGLPDLPSEIADVPRISAEVLASDEFSAAIETLLRPRERRAPPPRRRRTRPLGSYADILLSRTAQIGTEAELAALVSEALEKAGAEVIRESTIAERRRADIIAWHDDLTSLDANPLVVEVRRFVGPSRDPELESSFEAFLAAAGTRVGLVVYLDGPGRHVDRLPGGNGHVAFVQTRELIDRLRNDRLPVALATLLRYPSSR